MGSEDTILNPTPNCPKCNRQVEFKVAPEPKVVSQLFCTVIIFEHMTARCKCGAHLRLVVNGFQRVNVAAVELPQPERNLVTLPN